MTGFLEIVRSFLPLLVTLALVLATLLGAHITLRRRWAERPEAQFQFQLIMLALTLAGLLALVVALPVSDTLQGQLLSLIGILLSAAIALSSATFIGNILASIMLKAVGSARPGDFITVASLTGRITEMGLLHTEIQTEFRDLVTVPNIYMVTQPVKVVRASGTIITAEVSLGFDVPHNLAREVLRTAAEASGLKDCFVHLRELGNFSVTYRAAGLLEDVQSLLSARSQLHECMLDALHGAGIEIVSPTFMNTRAYEPGALVLPPEAKEGKRPSEHVQAEEVAFDKAEEAASAEKLRLEVERLDEELAALREGGEGEAEQRAQQLTLERERLKSRLQAALAGMQAKERDESKAAG
ncbi:mechanosensitive ion channel domain-containing protein [Pseudohaliea sp.]|uniref:mechanosensitive ion channel domain-containing protein n=1 Tax=Pseudohaliea sp. TaxID=2740289 RepID=UPI0032EB59B5